MKSTSKKDKLDPSILNGDSYNCPIPRHLSLLSSKSLLLGTLCCILLLLIGYHHGKRSPMQTNLDSEKKQDCSPIDGEPDFRPIQSYRLMEDLENLKGTFKEAYALLLCTGPDGDYGAQMNFESLRISIHRLQQLLETHSVSRDIIVAVCQYTPYWQYHLLKNLKVILLPVHTIKDDAKITKFIFWRLVQWERLLVLDIDIFFKDDFFTIWDEPASQPKYKPDLDWENEEYFGFPVKSLYPYLFSAVIDTSDWTRSKLADKFNAGMYLIRPNLAHYNLLMKVSLSKESPESVLNIVYRRVAGPIPWCELNETYNYFPHWNPLRTVPTKALHIKPWMNEVPEKYVDAIKMWNEFYIDMRLDCMEITILPTSKFRIDRNSIHIEGLSVSYGKAKYYAIASTNLTHSPTQEDIMESLLSTSKTSYGLGASSSYFTDVPSNLTIDGLNESTSYNVYYFASTTAKYSRLTQVYWQGVKTLD